MKNRLKPGLTGDLYYDTNFLEVIVSKKQQKQAFVPFIVGKRVSLAVIEDSDAEYLYRWINDEEGRALLGGQTRPTTLEQERAWIRDRSKDGHFLVFTIVLNRTGQRIGTISLFHIDLHSRSAESGMYVMEKSLRGKGYGPEAKALLLKHAFHSMGLNRVQARVLSTNTASIRSITKSGYVLEGVLRQAAFRNGRYIDMNIYSILREEWEKQNH